MIVARLIACQTANSEEVTVWVREIFGATPETPPNFEVFIGGGLLGNGQESAVYTTIGSALQRASDEVAIALGGN